MKDLHNNVKLSAAFLPVAAITDNTPFVSTILDCANFEKNEIGISPGALADADVTLTTLMEESDDSAMSGANAVADADLIGTEAAASYIASEDNTVKKLGYKGQKRYIRVTITPANNTGNLFMSGLWLQEGARVYPIA